MRSVIVLLTFVLEQRDALIKSIALIKRNALAAPFELAFQSQKQLEAAGSGQSDLMALHYRDEEAIYVQASPDRVTVIFSTVFKEETDRIFGKVFLQVCTYLRNITRRANHALRNSLMPVVYRQSRVPLKFYTPPASPL